VSDYNTHALHVLSGQGDILTCKVMEDNGIEYPWTLNLDMKGTIFTSLKLNQFLLDWGLGLVVFVAC
jgi:hypothetical protein